MLRIPHIDLKRRAPALGLVALYAYLAFHAFSGSQGVLSWVSYAETADGLRTKLETRMSEHSELRKQVEALSNESLDLDALEIEVRRNLFVSDVTNLYRT